MQGAAVCAPSRADEAAWRTQGGRWHGVSAAPALLSDHHEEEELDSGRAERRVIGYVTSALPAGAFGGSNAVALVAVSAVTALRSRQFVTGARGGEGVFVLLCAPNAAFQRPAYLAACAVRDTANHPC